MNEITVLIIDDDAATRETLTRALGEAYTVFVARNVPEALHIMAEYDIRVVLSDLLMPGMDGIAFLEQMKSLEHAAEVIMISGHATVEKAVEAMKMGAYDFVTKPVNIDRLEMMIAKAAETGSLREENRALKSRISSKYAQLSLDGESKEIREVQEVVKQVSKTTATVLIEGESGTGKERVANMIHYHSPMAAGPFVKVNCSAFAEGVLESELFGHEKGSFTGATYAKKGRFELADGGTLFLDEIGDLTPAVQVKLLRFLQEKTFERVGGTRTIQVNVRIVSATNKNLKDMVGEGKFREDLYYRLRVVRIDVPPLRQRQGDIELLVHIFIKHFSEIHNKPIHGITPTAMAQMKRYNWPGNVRELMNCIESSVVMARGDEIANTDLPDYMTCYKAEKASGLHDGLLEDLEMKTIAKVLRQTDGDKNEAARILGIGLRTLYRKLKKMER